MKYAGIDPGSNTGIVVVDVTNGRIQIAGHCRVSASSSTKLSKPQADATLFLRIAEFLAYYADNLHTIVLEEPSDASAQFKGTGGEGSGMARGTHFRVGAAYGLAVAACYHSWSNVETSSLQLVSYPATTIRSRNRRPIARVGWMDNGGRIPRRDYTLFVLREYLRASCGATDIDKWSEHEVMAFGVLRYHLSQNGIVP